MFQGHVYELTFCALAASKKCSDGVKYNRCYVLFLKGCLNRWSTEAVNTVSLTSCFYSVFYTLVPAPWKVPLQQLIDITVSSVTMDVQTTMTRLLLTQLKTWKHDEFHATFSEKRPYSLSWLWEALRVAQATAAGGVVLNLFWHGVEYIQEGLLQWRSDLKILPGVDQCWQEALRRNLEDISLLKQFL